MHAVIYLALQTFLIGPAVADEIYGVESGKYLIYYLLYDRVLYIILDRATFDPWIDRFSEQ